MTNDIENEDNKGASNRGAEMWKEFLADLRSDLISISDNAASCEPHGRASVQVLDIPERIALGAAQTWAELRAHGACDGKQFGVHVMHVYLAAIAAHKHQDDAQALAAAIAALSLPAEAQGQAAASILPAESKPFLENAPDRVGGGCGGSGGGQGGDSGALPANGAARPPVLNDEGGFDATLNACVTKVMFRHRDRFTGRIFRSAQGISHENAFVVTSKIDAAVMDSFDFLFLDLLDSLREDVALRLRLLEKLHGIECGALGLCQAGAKL